MIWFIWIKLYDCIKHHIQRDKLMIYLFWVEILKKGCNQCEEIESCLKMIVE